MSADGPSLGSVLFPLILLRATWRWRKGPLVAGSLKCLHQSLQFSVRAVEALSRVDNFNFDNTPLPSTDGVGRLNSVSAIVEQPSDHSLTHFCSPSVSL
jgi:hypothetical protein